MALERIADGNLSGAKTVGGVPEYLINFGFGESYKDSCRTDRPPVILQRGIPKDVGSGAKRNVEPEDARTNGCNEKREKTAVVLIDGLSIAPLSRDTTQTMDVQLLFARVLMPPKAYFFEGVILHP